MHSKYYLNVYFHLLVSVYIFTESENVPALIIFIIVIMNTITEI